MSFDITKFKEQGLSNETTTRQSLFTLEVEDNENFQFIIKELEFNQIFENDESNITFYMYDAPNVAEFAVDNQEHSAKINLFSIGGTVLYSITFDMKVLSKSMSLDWSGANTFNTWTVKANIKNIQIIRNE